MTRTIDLNCDLGEGWGAWTIADDAALLDVVTSANVACGSHAGDPRIMAATCAAAVERGVAIGAHVGYRDLAGFGRRFLDVPPDELAAEVTFQIGALVAVARAAGGRVTYVKPHGALYNALVHHAGQAGAVVRAVAGFDGPLPVVGLPQSELLAQARAAGLPTVLEAFADRGYRADGTLVPRSEPGALVTRPDDVAERCARLVRDGVVRAVDGTEVPLDADSVCVHSDTPGALELLRAARSGLEGAGAELRAFAP